LRAEELSSALARIGAEPPVNRMFRVLAQQLEAQLDHGAEIARHCSPHADVRRRRMLRRAG